MMSDETSKRYHAIVYGRVQNVSFRWYTTQQALDLGLTGWVYNRSDGAVEIIAEGAEKALYTLHDWLHDGSPAATVERIEASWGDATGEFTVFKTRYDREL